jgi:sugar/nucleoside kinase (ribokinase family)
VLFLANIQPELQLEVRNQCPRARFVALDSMNLWINIAHAPLMKVIERVDLLLLNDEELEMLTGEHSTLLAAQKVLEWGPSAVIAKLGKYGAALYTRDGFFAIPAYPLAAVVDPTGAGDTFAGGIVGYVAAHPEEEVTHDLLTRAMAYGTALASFNVEAFGTERMVGLTAGEVHERVEDLARMTSFASEPVALRG